MTRRLMMLSLLFLTPAGTPAAGPANGVILPEATLERALENGCSLVVARILSVQREGAESRYQAEIVRTIIPGDLDKAEAHRPWEFLAGGRYATALQSGSHYVMFLRPQCPYDFGWAFADDVARIDPGDKDTVGRLVAVAERVYAGTSIRQFRRTRPWVKAVGKVDLPALPDELVALCRQFREGAGRRAELGRRIAASDLGSRRDLSGREADLRYRPPGISLSRRQVLALLGEPTWQSGWTYEWCCDDFVSAGEGGNEIGVLSVTFDRSERDTRVLFEMQERSNWVRPHRPQDEFTALDGDPGGVAHRFLEALQQSDWDRALSLCSDAVRARAPEFASAQAFLKHFVPVENLAALSEFRPRGFGSREGRVVEVSAEVRLEVPNSQWPVEWRWALVRSGGTWAIDFELTPLEQFVQKELLKQSFAEQGPGGRLSALDARVELELVPALDQFVIGRPMLFTLRMKNITDTPVVYMGTPAVMTNDPMLVTGPDGATLPYVDTQYQTAGGIQAILPGEVKVLADRYDVTSQYRIIRPGRYRFQFRGLHPGGKPSNVCEVEVRPGPLPDTEVIVDKLLAVLPAGERFTRTLRAGSDDEAARQLYIDLGTHVVLLVILGGDPAATDPWLKQQFDFWGLCPWGPVYARVREADPLWPDPRAAIQQALEIKAPQGQ
jgi:hypothetical protein